MDIQCIDENYSYLWEVWPEGQYRAFGSHVLSYWGSSLEVLTWMDNTLRDKGGIVNLCTTPTRTKDWPRWAKSCQSPCPANNAFVYCVPSQG